MPCQASTTMRVTRAECGLPNQATGECISPVRVSTALTSPWLGSSNHIQMSATSTLGVAQGIMASPRTTPRSRNRWLSSSAPITPNTTCRPTPPVVHATEFRRYVGKLGSENSDRKLSRPTNPRVPPSRLVLVNESQIARKNG